MVEKDFSEAFKIIENVNNIKGTLTIDGYRKNKLEAFLKLKEERIIIEVLEPVSFEIDKSKRYNLTFECDFDILYLPEAFIQYNHQLNCNFISNEINNDKLYFSKKSYYRAIIPANKGVHFYHIFQTLSYCEGSYSSSECMLLNIQKFKCHFMIYKNNNKNYLIIDCIKKIKYSEFSSIVFAIQVSYAFITGKFYQNEIYYMAYNNRKFDDIQYYIYQKMRKSVLKGHQLVTSNPFSISRDRKELEKYNKKLNLFSQNDFSSLCGLVLSDDQILTILLMLIELLSYPLETQTVCYSVALETISTYYSEKNKDLLKPIQNKKLFKSIKRKCIDIISQEKDKLPEESFDIISKKIENLNSPTNQDKLAKVFINNNIVLSDDEKEIFKLRNKLLHGQYVELYKGYSHEERSLKLFILGVRTHFLISRVILKLSGYDGYLINQPKLLYESTFDVKLPGEYFIKNTLIECS